MEQSFAELTKKAGHGTRVYRVAGASLKATTSLSWGGRAPREVLAALVQYWRSGTGFVLWGEALVERWVRSLHLGEMVSFGQSEDAVPFMELLLEGKCERSTCC